MKRTWKEWQALTDLQKLWLLALIAFGIGIELWLGNYAFAAEPSVFRGEIPGYLVTISVDEPTWRTDGVYNVLLCPPTSPLECANGIAGTKFMSWKKDQWFVSLNVKSTPTVHELFRARKQLNRAMRSICESAPACAAADGNAV